jgi:hypothetical protein
MDDKLLEWKDDFEDPLDEVHFNHEEIQIHRSSFHGEEELTESEVMRREEDQFNQRKMRNEDQRQ